MKQGDTLIGSSPRAARRAGIHLHGRTIAADGPTVRFEDGGEAQPATVVWATGFALDHGWIDAPIFDEQGRVRHTRGVTPAPGLFFVGLPWMHTRGSALLGFVKADAAYIAGLISPTGSRSGSRRLRSRSRSRLSLARRRSAISA
jgi:putative flavoprotein involved in K+ transport